MRAVCVHSCRRPPAHAGKPLPTFTLWLLCCAYACTCTTLADGPLPPLRLLCCTCACASRTLRPRSSAPGRGAALLRVAPPPGQVRGTQTTTTQVGKNTTQVSQAVCRPGHGAVLPRALCPAHLLPRRPMPQPTPQPTPQSPEGGHTAEPSRLTGRLGPALSGGWNPADLADSAGGPG